MQKTLSLLMPAHLPHAGAALSTTASSHYMLSILTKMGITKLLQVQKTNIFIFWMGRERPSGGTILVRACAACLLVILTTMVGTKSSQELKMGVCMLIVLALYEGWSGEFAVLIRHRASLRSTT